MNKPKKNNDLSCYELLTEKEISDVVHFGFTRTGFNKFKAAFEVAKDRAWQRQK